MHYGGGAVTVYDDTVHLESDFEVGGPGPKFHVYLVPSPDIASASQVKGTMFVDLVRLHAAEDFLGLSPEEVAYIEMKLALGKQLRAERKRQRLSQKAVADRIKSSQSRVAKMEAGDSAVSLDLLVKSLFSLGPTKKDLAKAIASTARAHAT